MQIVLEGLPSQQTQDFLVEGLGLFVRLLLLGLRLMYLHSCEKGQILLFVLRGNNQSFGCLCPFDFERSLLHYFLCLVDEEGEGVRGVITALRRVHEERRSGVGVGLFFREIDFADETVEGEVLLRKEALVADLPRGVGLLHYDCNNS